MMRSVGSAYNVKTKGMEPGLGALPHPAFWQEVSGFSHSEQESCAHKRLPHQSQVKALVEDGVRYTSARIAEARGGSSTDAAARRSSYTSLSEAKDSADSAQGTTAAPAPAVPVEEEEQEDGSDESLVE
jgi:hypothetical protein